MLCNLQWHVIIVTFAQNNQTIHASDAKLIASGDCRHVSKQFPEYKQNSTINDI